MSKKNYQSHDFSDITVSLQIHSLMSKHPHIDVFEQSCYVFIYYCGVQEDHSSICIYLLSGLLIFHAKFCSIVFYAVLLLIGN